MQPVVVKKSFLLVGSYKPQLDLKKLNKLAKKQIARSEKITKKRGS